MAEKITVPELGEGVIEAQIGRWLKHEGDVVHIDDPLVEIETDKITTEIVAEVDGTLLKIVVTEGQIAHVGAPLAVIGAPGEVLETNGHSTPDAIDPAPDDSIEPDQDPISERPKISPIARRIARENQLDVDRITGTGLHGRITKRDVERRLVNQAETATPASVKPSATPAPSPQPAPTLSRPAPATVQPPVTAPIRGNDKLVSLTGMRRVIADRMVRSKQISPHATTIFKIDFSAVLNHRRNHRERFAERGLNLTLTSYILAAVCQALQNHPIVNSQWTDDGILLKSDINLGVATAVPHGLLVPVINNADRLNLAGLAERLNDLTQRARHNQLKPHELQDGTFTITNHGVSGSLLATPIINQPQCGILGVGKVEKQVVVLSDHGQDAIVVRPLAYISFTFDHRLIDGATADAFVADIKAILEAWS